MCVSRHMPCDQQLCPLPKLPLTNNSIYIQLLPSKPGPSFFLLTAFSFHYSPSLSKRQSIFWVYTTSLPHNPLSLSNEAEILERKELINQKLRIWRWKLIKIQLISYFCIVINCLLAASCSFLSLFDQFLQQHSPMVSLQTHNT